MFKLLVLPLRLSHAVSRFTGQAVGGLITLWSYVTDWRSAKSGIRIRKMTRSEQELITKGEGNVFSLDSTTVPVYKSLWRLCFE